MNTQIGVEESKYGVIGDPYLQVVNGSRDLIFEFWDPLSISGTVEARNFKFGKQIDPQGTLMKEMQN